MPPAARITDPTAHPGTITPPGMPTVMVGGLPAAVASGMHTCMLPPPAGPHSPTPFPTGSATVQFGGLPALRVGDMSGCGSPIVAGLPTVEIGG